MSTWMRRLEKLHQTLINNQWGWARNNRRYKRKAKKAAAWSKNKAVKLQGRDKKDCHACLLPKDKEHNNDTLRHSQNRPTLSTHTLHTQFSNKSLDVCRQDSLKPQETINSAVTFKMFQRWGLFQLSSCAIRTHTYTSIHVCLHESTGCPVGRHLSQ